MTPRPDKSVRAKVRMNRVRVTGGMSRKNDWKSKSPVSRIFPDGCDMVGAREGISGGKFLVVEG